MGSVVGNEAMATPELEKVQEIVARIADGKEDPTDMELRIMLEYDRFMYLTNENLMLQAQVSNLSNLSNPVKP